MSDDFRILSEDPMSAADTWSEILCLSEGKSTISQRYPNTSMSSIVLTYRHPDIPCSFASLVRKSSSGQYTHPYVLYLDNTVVRTFRIQIAHSLITNNSTIAPDEHMMASRAVPMTC